MRVSTEHWARVEEEWKSTPSLEMRKVAKSATGLNSYGVGNHALNLMAVPSSKQPMIWQDYVCKADRKDNCKIFEHKSVKLSRAQAPAIPKILLILVKLAPCIPPVFLLYSGHNRGATSDSALTGALQNIWVSLRPDIWGWRDINCKGPNRFSMRQFQDTK